MLAARLALMAVVVCVMASCVKDDKEVTLSRECYISKVSLGTLTRKVVVNDTTTVTGTYNGSYYAMRIDQLACTITNPEPLLYNTIMGNVLITISGSGVIQYRPENQLEETWMQYSSSDSINISAPIRLRVFSPDGSSSREYRMTFNVQKEDPDGFTWKQLAPSALGGSTRTKAVWANDSVMTVLAATASGVATHIALRVADTLQWQDPVSSTSGDIARASVETMALCNNTLWVTTTDSLLLNSTDNGLTWQTVAAQPLRLLCASDTTLYAITTHGRMCHSDDAQQWMDDTADTPELLPMDDPVGIVYSIDSRTSRAVVIGHRSGDKHASLWARTISRDFGGEWIYCPWADGNKYLCPWLERPVLAYYNNQLALTGGALDAVYISVDNAITWKPGYGWTIPNIKNDTETATMAADAGGMLWLMCGNTVYRGRAHTIK